MLANKFLESLCVGGENKFVLFAVLRIFRIDQDNVR